MTNKPWREEFDNILKNRMRMNNDALLRNEILWIIDFISGVELEAYKNGIKFGTNLQAQESTLERLIEKCGDLSFELKLIYATKRWSAHGSIGYGGVTAEGKTPQEAVENLLKALRGEKI